MLQQVLGTVEQPQPHQLCCTCCPLLILGTEGLPLEHNVSESVQHCGVVMPAGLWSPTAQAGCPVPEPVEPQQSLLSTFQSCTHYTEPKALAFSGHCWCMHNTCVTWRTPSYVGKYGIHTCMQLIGISLHLCLTCCLSFYSS